MSFDTPEAAAVEAADIRLAKGLARHREHPVVVALGAAAQVGDQAPLIAVSGAVIAWGLARKDPRRAGAGARMLLSVLAATAIKSAVKRLVSRTRPNVLLDEGHYEVKPLGPDEGPWHSFPSGHTAGSVAAARALGSVYPDARAPAYAAAAAIALIQIPRGRHFPIDVAAGALVGLASAAAAERLYRAWAPKLAAAGRGGAGREAPGRPDGQGA